MSKTIRVAMQVTQILECWCEVEVTDQQYEDYCNNLAEPKDFLLRRHGENGLARAVQPRLPRRRD